MFALGCQNAQPIFYVPAVSGRSKLQLKGENKFLKIISKKWKSG